MSGRLRALLARLRSVLTPGEDLLERSVTGGIWLTLLNVSGRVFQILTVVVLARLLTPREFGVVGVAMLVIVGLRRVSKLGLNDALIFNKKTNVDPYLNTAWVMNIARGLVITVTLALVAPLIAGVFSEPRVTEVLRVMAIGPLLFSLKNPAIVYFRKHMEFHRQFGYEVSGDVVYFLVAVGYALFDPSVWALAFGYLGRNVARLFASYILHGNRPRPAFDLSYAKEMIDYGKWITGSHMANYIRNEGDDIFIGWLLGPAALGFYQMAYRLSNAPATEVTHVISRVTFPAYSEVQDDKEMLRAAFLKTVRLSAFVAAPMAVGIGVVTPTFVRAVLGEQWLAMIVPMQILALYGLQRGYASSFGSVWQATGNPDYLVKLQLFTVAVMAIFIYPASVRYGISGAALVVAGVYLIVMMPINTYLAADSAGVSVWRVTREFALPLPAAAAMGVIVFWAQGAIQGIPVAAKFALLVVIGVVTYPLAVFLMERRIEWGIITELRELRRAM